MLAKLHPLRCIAEALHMSSFQNFLFSIIYENINPNLVMYQLCGHKMGLIPHLTAL